MKTLIASLILATIVLSSVANASPVERITFDKPLIVKASPRHWVFAPITIKAHVRTASRHVHTEIAASREIVTPIPTVGNGSCEWVGPRLDGVKVQICDGSVVAYRDASGYTVRPNDY